MHPLLLETAHRPIAMPSGPWIMKQKWHDLLFAHWPLSPEKIRPLVPQELELDLREGSAWVAVAPFWMSGIRARLAPPLPFLSKFCELNVRTYVRYKGVPGVYFFSLDAASLPAVVGARATYKLPYFHAAMLVRSSGESCQYTSSRLQEPRRQTSTRVTGQLRRREFTTRVPSKHLSQSAIAFIQSIKAASFARTSIICRGSCRMPKRSLTSMPWRKPLALHCRIPSRCCIFPETSKC